MKAPRTPPSPLVVEPRADIGPEVRGSYLHWDDLRHRAPPHGLSHAQWWQLVKARRRWLYQSIPLFDRQGRDFVFAMTDSVNRLAHQLDREMASNIGAPGDVVNPETRDRYVVSSLMEEAITSSQLEGAHTSRRVAAEMLRSGRPARDRGEQMIVNNYRAMEWLRSRTDQPLTRSVVLHLHQLVTEDAIDTPDAAGRFRRADEPIAVLDEDGEVVHTPPDASELEERIAAMCDFANDDGEEGTFIHPVVRAILLHFWLAYDHPFVDGNGRTARALFYWSMLRQGYWLTEFVTISRTLNKARAQYARAYQHVESDDNDVTYFVVHQLHALKQAVADLFAYLQRKSREARTVEAALRAQDLNHRQLALLGHALRHPDAIYTIAGHKTSHRIVYDTARLDLLELVDRGLLDQRKRGKAHAFTPVKNLSRKLGSSRA